MEKIVSGKVIELVLGDITRQAVDAIVNAANSTLLGGGGVDGAIHRAGGPAILDACRAIRAERGDCPTGEAVLTGGGGLPARYVIHAVGPVWGDGDEDQKLANAINGSLALAERLEIKSIAMPAISTGIFGFPKERAARIILNSAREFLSSKAHSHLELVRLTLYDRPTLDVFLQVWSALGLKSDL